MLPPPTESPPPSYDTSKIDEEIQHLQEKDPSPAGADGILRALKRSQMDILAEEINKSIQNTLALQSSLNQILRDLGSVGQQSSSPISSYASKCLEHCCNLSSQLLWKGRELAASTAGPQCIDGFINVIVNGVVVDPSVPPEDVVDELAGFIENLPSCQKARLEGNLAELSEVLGRAQHAIKSIPGMGDDDDLGPEAVRVKLLERELAGAELDYGHLLPRYLQALGVDANIPMIVLIVGLIPMVVFNALLGDPGRNIRTFSEIITTYDRMLALRTQLNQARGELLQNTSGGSSKAQWRQVSIKIDEAKQRLSTDVRSSFTTLNRIRDAVRNDCLIYLSFIQGPESKDPAVKEAEIKKLQASAMLYEQLRVHLRSFANAVVPDLPPYTQGTRTSRDLEIYFQADGNMRQGSIHSRQAQQHVSCDRSL